MMSSASPPSLSIRTTPQEASPGTAPGSRRHSAQAQPLLSPSSERRMKLDMARKHLKTFQQRQPRPPSASSDTDRLPSPPRSVSVSGKSAGAASPQAARKVSVAKPAGSASTSSGAAASPSATSSTTTSNPTNLPSAQEQWARQAEEYEAQIRKMEETIHRLTASPHSHMMATVGDPHESADVHHLRRNLAESKAKVDALQKQNLIILRNANQVEEVNKTLNRRNLELADKIKLQAATIAQLETNVVLRSPTSGQARPSLLNAAHEKAVEEMAHLQTANMELQRKQEQLEETLREREKKMESVANELASVYQKFKSEERNAQKQQEALAESNKQMARVQQETVGLRETIAKLELERTELLNARQNEQAKVREESGQQLAEHQSAWTDKEAQWLDKEIQWRKDRESLEAEVAKAEERKQQEINLATQLSRTLREKEELQSRLAEENRTILAQLNELRERFVGVMNDNAKMMERSQRAETRSQQLVTEVRSLESYRDEVDKLKEIIRIQTQTNASLPSPDTMRFLLEEEQQKVRDLERIIRDLKTELAARLVPLPVSPIRRPPSVQPDWEQEEEVEEEHGVASVQISSSNSRQPSPSPAANETSAKAPQPSSPAPAYDWKTEQAELMEKLWAVQAERNELEKWIAEMATVQNELKAQLEQVQHLNEQLSMETETVPLYIERFHEERRLLRAKGMEKDRLINDLVLNQNALSEKVSLMVATIQRLRLEERKRSQSPSKATSPDRLEIGSEPRGTGQDDHGNENVDALVENTMRLTDEALKMTAPLRIAPTALSPKSKTSPVERFFLHGEEYSRYLEYPPCPGCNTSKPMEV